LSGIALKSDASTPEGETHSINKKVMIKLNFIDKILGV